MRESWRLPEHLEDEAARKALAMSPQGCMCPNNGAGDCDYCENYAIAYDELLEQQEEAGSR